MRARTFHTESGVALGSGGGPEEKGTIVKSLWKPVAAALLSLVAAWALCLCFSGSSVSEAVQFEAVDVVATIECRARFFADPFAPDEEEEQDGFDAVLESKSSSLSRLIVTMGSGKGSWWPRMGSPKASFFSRKKWSNLRK